MSAPPSAIPPAGNPDRRTLPEGWTTRWDEKLVALYIFLTGITLTRSLAIIQQLSCVVRWHILVVISLCDSWDYRFLVGIT